MRYKEALFDSHAHHATCMIHSFGPFAGRDLQAAAQVGGRKRGRPKKRPQPESEDVEDEEDDEEDEGQLQQQRQQQEEAVPKQGEGRPATVASSASHQSQDERIQLLRVCSRIVQLSVEQLAPYAEQSIVAAEEQAAAAWQLAQQVQLAGGVLSD